MTATSDSAGRPLKAPRAAAVAGILFSALLSTTLLLIWSVIPAEHSTDVPSLQQGEGTIDLALSLVPFAAVAYLWFIGVVRDRLGAYEDKLFSTVYFGSALLFLGMYMTCAASFGALIHLVHVHQADEVGTNVFIFGRRLTYLVLNVYAMKMAAMFMMSTSAVAFRTGILPRWLSFTGILMALCVIFGAGVHRTFVLVFPAWVLLMSVVILVTNLRMPSEGKESE